MAPCCTNTVTPKMIKTGQVQIGDKIQLEELLAPEAVAPAVIASVTAPITEPTVSQVGIPTNFMPTNATSAPETSAPAVAIPACTNFVPEIANSPCNQAMPDFDNVPAVALMPTTPAPQSIPQMRRQPMTNISQPVASPAVQPEMQARPTMQAQAGMQPQAVNVPLRYVDMTPYMELTTLSMPANIPTLTVPQSPLTTSEFSETIDLTSVQGYTGFLRTQMGRFMRVEQLLGSSEVVDRYGFLVGIGTNFIILQEITTGNIMVIDLFTIRLTYIYYSEPVLPSFTPVF